MDFDELFGGKPRVVDLRAEDRWQAIDELLEHLAATNTIKPADREVVAEAVKKRESAMSTGIGYGIAIPHASTDLVADILVVIGRSRKGIGFDSLDGKLVNIVILFLVPKGGLQKHINTLANIAKLIHRPDFLDWLWGL